MIKSVQTVSLLDLLPDNLLADEQINATARALDTELSKATAATLETLLIARINELPEPVLDLLAWQWHVDFYEPLGMDVETKRKLIINSIAWHRIKGTAAAVQKMVEAAWDGCNVEEWFDYGGEPYHFRVVNVTAARVDSDVIRNVLRAIYATKNVRSWLDGINFLRNIDTTLYCGGVFGVHKRFEVRPARPKGADVEVKVYIGGAQGIHKHIMTGPRLVTYSEARATPYTGGAMKRHRRITVTQKEES